jgi:hypothetical protein
MESVHFGPDLEPGYAMELMDLCFISDAISAVPLEEDKMNICV